MSAKRKSWGIMIIRDAPHFRQKIRFEPYLADMIDIRRYRLVLTIDDGGFGSVFVAILH